MTDRTQILERRVAVGGVTSRVLEVEGAGPPILLLHGFTDSADTWRPVLAHLARLGRRAVAVDLPGHGRAAPLRRPVLETLDDFVDDFLEAYADEPAVLAGNSLGGMLSLRAASRPTPRLVAVAGLGPAGLAYTRRITFVARAATILHPVLRLLDGLPAPRPWLDASARAVHRRLSEGQADEDLAGRYASHFRDGRDLARLRGDLVALSAAGDDEAVDVAALGARRVPVLLLWGSRDRLADIRGADKLLRAVPFAQLVVLDAGHCPQLQLATEVAEHLAALPHTLVPDVPEGRA